MKDGTKEVEAATGMVQLGWPGGVLTLRHAGIATVDTEAQDEIRNVMQQFQGDCQMMLVWFAGVVGSRDAIRRHLDEVFRRSETLSVSSFRPDGRVESVFARLPVEKVIDAFANSGAFERLYAKAFVVFMFQIWEEVARPGIAAALKVESSSVQAELMGEWRRLRNWLVHRHKDTEGELFRKAAKPPGLLGLRREDPGLTAGMVYVLMRELNRMQIDVNPESLQFGLELVTLDAGTIASIVKTLEPRTGAVVPAEAAKYPSGVLIVFNSESATIHERDCDRKDTEFQSVDRGRWVRVSSFEVARAVVERLGIQERLCEHCRA